MSRHFTSNPYYHPEHCGLEMVDELDGEQDYSFDKVVIWKDLESDKYYYAHDSGCSCPSPFEDYHNLDDLGELSSDTFHGFKEACENLYNVDKQELATFLQRSKQLI